MGGGAYSAAGFLSFFPKVQTYYSMVDEAMNQCPPQTHTRKKHSLHSSHSDQQYLGRNSKRSFRAKCMGAPLATVRTPCTPTPAGLFWDIPHAFFGVLGVRGGDCSLLR